jgi:D-sedoheptulose 7-phosphate isomerase
MMKRYILNEISESIKINQLLLSDTKLTDEIESVSKAIIKAFKNGNKILIAGNGGSASDAQHFAGEFVGKFNLIRPGLPAIELTSNAAVLTSIGNDSGYIHVFERQIEALGNKGDLFIAISTSGNSENILCAFNACKQKGVLSIGLTGNNHGKMQKLCDQCLIAPSTETPRIQEVHSLLIHIICGLVEKEIYANQYS